MYMFGAGWWWCNGDESIVENFHLGTNNSLRCGKHIVGAHQTQKSCAIWQNKYNYSGALAQMYVVFVYNAPATPEKTHRNKLVLLRWQLTRLCVSGETNECSRIYGDGSGGSTPPVTHCQMEKRPNCKFFQQTFDFICGVPTKINTDILHRSRKALCNLGIWLFPRDFCSCVSYSWVLMCVCEVRWVVERIHTSHFIQLVIPGTVGCWCTVKWLLIYMAHGEFAMHINSNLFLYES